MSLSSMMNIAASGMQTAQAQLRVVSDNVSNVNTPGYIRKIADQQALTSTSVGAGVEVARVRLATDRFLQAASLNAGAEAGRQTVRYELYDRIQSLFGDPGSDSGFFAGVDSLFSSFAAAAENPTSSPVRQDVLSQAQTLFDEGARISRQIQAVREDADARLQSAVQSANGLLEQIEALNQQIARATAVNADSTGAQAEQVKLISQLSELMDIRTTERAIGGVSIRTGSGALLAGDGHATLSYGRAGAVTAETAFNDIWITEPHGGKQPLLDSLGSGQIKGLVELRDVDAPQAAERLGELMTRLADELNRAHNANAASPPPTTLTGRNVGQDLETAIAGFSGETTISIVNAAGVVQARANIDFTAGTINGAAFTPASFLATLNAELGGAAVSFANGVLTVNAGGSNGVAIADSASNPSDKAGRGFSHYFGLNDLIVTDRPVLYDQGLTATSAHGFTAGQTLTLRFSEEGGARLRDVTVAVPAGDTVEDLLKALNDPITGVGRYGAFGLDASGAVAFTPSVSPAPRMTVVDDRTVQTPSTLSMSALFGLGGARASRAEAFSIRSDIQQSPSKLALGQLDPDAAVGAVAISNGDGRGAALLAQAGGRTSTVFAAAGGASGGAMSLSRYASEMAGDIGGRASLAKSRQGGAQALYSEAKARQTAYEGVNLDEELVLMTTYQQAYNASARLIQAAGEMYDALLGMMR